MTGDKCSRVSDPPGGSQRNKAGTGSSHPVLGGDTHMHTHIHFHTHTPDIPTNRHRCRYTQRPAHTYIRGHRDANKHHIPAHAHTCTHACSPPLLVGSSRLLPPESPAPAPSVICPCFAWHTQDRRAPGAQLLPERAPRPLPELRDWRADKGQEANDDGAPSSCQTPGRAAPAPRGVFKLFGTVEPFV